MIQKFFRKAGDDGPEPQPEEVVVTCVPRSLFIRSLTLPSDPNKKKQWRFRKASLHAVQAHAEACIGQLLEASRGHAEQARFLDYSKTSLVEREKEG